MNTPGIKTRAIDKPVRATASEAAMDLVGKIRKALERLK